MKYNCIVPPDIVAAIGLDQNPQNFHLHSYFHYPLWQVVASETLIVATVNLKGCEREYGV
jgi:hypothetical protein